jgi:hypothetical protein
VCLTVVVSDATLFGEGAVTVDAATKTPAEAVAAASATGAAFPVCLQ